MTTIDQPNIPLRSPLFGRTTVIVILSLFDQLSISGTRFVTTVLLARVAGKGELGLFSIAFGFLLVATCFQEALLSSPFSLFIHKRLGQSKSQYQGSVLLMFFGIAALSFAAMGALWGVGLWGLKGMWLEGPNRWADENLLNVLGLLAISTPFVLLREFARRIEIARLRVHYAFAIDAIASLLQLLFIGGLLRLDGLNAQTVYVAMAVSSAIPAIAWILLSYGDWSVSKEGLAKEVKLHWDLAKWPLLAQIIGLIHLQGTLWVLGVMLGTEAAGKFAACNYVLFVINPIALGACSFVMPLAAKMFTEQGVGAARQLIARFMLGISLPVALVCAVVAWLSDWILVQLYNDLDYQGMGWFMAILGANMTLSVAHMINDQGVWAIEKPRWLFQSNAITAIITLGFVAPAIGGWGLYGAALCMLAGRAIGFFYQAILFFTFPMAVPSKNIDSDHATGRL
jgi:O-antigen/teichoic acid export membrane protein